MILRSKMNVDVLNVECLCTIMCGRRRYMSRKGKTIVNIMIS
jgi:hypothetical protein